MYTIRKLIYANGDEMVNSEIYKNPLTIAIGPDSFKALIKHDIYIDKTLFIKEIIDSNEKATLITYPRRWGKTLNLDMLKTFFEPELDEGKLKAHKYQENRQIFEALKIGKGGYTDTNEIAYRITLIRNDTLTKITASKQIEIANLLSFVNKEYILKNFKTNEEADQQLASEIKKYVLLLKQNFLSIDNLEDLIKEYHKVSDKEAVADNVQLQIVKQEKNEKFELLRKAIEDKIEQWKENDLEKYQEIKQDFDLIGMNQGKYPVIFLSLKDVIGNSVEEIEIKLKLKISDVFGDHKYLLDFLYKTANDQKLDYSERKAATKSLKKYEKIYDGDGKEATTVELQDSLYFLSELLYNYHEKQVYILVDEYDKPVNYLLEQSLTSNIKERDDISKLITSMMSSCGKGNKYLNKIILTGIFDTFQKEGGSGFNNLSVYGITSGKFSKSFGFSEDEVEILLKQLNFREDYNLLKGNIKDWYDGYTVPIGHNQTISAYTPWAVMKYLNSAYDSHYQPESYWSKSGASTILLMILRTKVSTPIIEKLTGVIEGSKQVMEYNKLTSLFQSSITNIGNIEEMVTYLLVNSGYLTTQRIGNSYHFSIPNHEVREEFKSVLLKEITNGVEIWQGESNMLKQLVDVFNAEYDTIKIFQAISKQEYSTLEKILNSSQSIKCDSDSYNFNLLHLGAVSGDVAIFNLLLKFCDKDLLKAKDPITGFNALNYAHLSKNQEIINEIEKLDLGLYKYFQIPDCFTSILCYKIHDITAGPMAALVATGTTVVKLTVDKIMPGYGKVAIGVATAFFSICTKDISKTLEKSICVDYNNYHGTNEIQLQSLKEFAKYGMVKANVYTTLQECNQNDSKLSTLKLPIFNKAHLGDKHLNFTLCAHVCDSESVANTKLCVSSEYDQNSCSIEDILIGGIGGAAVLGLLGLTGYAVWHQLTGE